MPLLEFVTGVIADVSLQAAREHLSRREAVIRALKRARLDPQPKREDFEAIYKHTLVEWGLFKPAELLDFYRDEYVYRAFKDAFAANDAEILRREVEDARQRYEEQGFFRRLETDPRREIAAFTTVFNEIVDRTRAPAEVKRDYKLERLDEKIDQILTWTREAATPAELKVLERDGYVLVGNFSQAIINIQSRLDDVEQNVGVSGFGKADRERLRPYLEMLARRGGRLPLGPLDPKGRDSAQIDLARVFINVNAENWNFVDISSEPQRAWAYSAAIAHIHDNGQIILRGDPGSGKSTLLRFLSFCLAQGFVDPDGGWLEKLSWTEERWIETGETTRSPADEDRFLEQVEPSSTESLSGRPRPRREDEREMVACHWQAGAPIPITVELRDFAKSDFDPDSPTAVWKYVAELLRRDDFEDIEPVIRKFARQGQVLFLLDGVDEVSPDSRPLVWRAIAAMGRGPYGGCRWVATCRVLSFVPEEAPADVLVRTIAPLSDEQIEAFIDNWYGALVEVGEASVSEANAKIRSLKSAASTSNLRKLARNPMLLTLMAIVQTYYGTLPDERVKLYKQCVQTLLLRWQRHKEDSRTELPGPLAELGVKQDELERLLGEIGWEAHSRTAEREEAADIPEMDVIRLARKHFGGSLEKAEKFILYTENRAHLLIGRGGVDERVFAFPHRTFQEYLAACHLAGQRRFGRRAAELAADPDQWREVLNLAAGELAIDPKTQHVLIDQLDDMLPGNLPDDDNQPVWRVVWLAGEMATTVGRKGLEDDPETGAALLPRLRDALAALCVGGYLEPIPRAAAGVALGRLGDPREDVACKVPAMARIPAGPFRMGSDKKDKKSLYYDELAYDREEPSHEVKLDFAYAIGKYPVTVAQYRRFVEWGGYDPERSGDFWPGGGLAWLKKSGQYAPRYWDDPQMTVDNHPVVGVTWYEAVAYCAWLKATTGRRFRLPDEAMWEKAARGTDGRRWPWGNDFDKAKLNGYEGGIGRTSAVGIFPAGRSPYEVYDCAGNVLEWCSGPGVGASPYPFKPRPYEEDLNLKPNSRALRGGSWSHYNQYTRAAFRDNLDPSYRYTHIGFRVAELLSDSDF